jgi:hypothetical protein
MSSNQYVAPEHGEASQVVSVSFVTKAKHCFPPALCLLLSALLALALVASPAAYAQTHYAQTQQPDPRDKWITIQATQGPSDYVFDPVKNSI